MKNAFLLLFLFCSNFIFSQIKQPDYTSVDVKMSKIPLEYSQNIEGIAKYIQSNFNTETDKIRAVYFWTANNIRYDIENMFAVNYGETSQDKIDSAFKTKKGVCVHYAEVFNKIANSIGFQSLIVQGYTKQDGKIAQLSHVWCATKIDSKWYLFDPTWGAGGINNGVFIKKLNNSYFKIAPSKMIASHMPFDYLWQFSNYPINNQEFTAGKIQIDKSKKYFDFEKEMIRYNTLSETDKLVESIGRMEKNGINNPLIAERLEVKKKNLNYLSQGVNIDKLNSIVNEFNQAVGLLNDFVYYRNRKFKPTLPDAELKKMIQVPRDQIAKCQDRIYSVGNVGSENTSNLISVKKSINESLVQADEYLQFVNQYLSKSTLVRKTMFSKLSYSRR